MQQGLTRTPNKSLREYILEMLNEGPRKATDFLELPFDRSTIYRCLKLMKATEEIHRFGRGKTLTYSLDRVQPVFPAKKEKPKRLPDWPPIMLAWGGYTDKEPDKTAGTIIYGGRW